MRFSSRTILISAIGLLCLSNLVALYLNARITINHALFDKADLAISNRLNNLFTVNLSDINTTTTDHLKEIANQNTASVENITIEAKKAVARPLKTNTIYDQVRASIWPKPDLPHPTAEDIFYVEPIGIPGATHTFNKPEDNGVTFNKQYVSSDPQVDPNNLASVDGLAAPAEPIESDDYNSDDVFKNSQPPPINLNRRPLGQMNDADDIKINVKFSMDNSEPQQTKSERPPEPIHTRTVTSNVDYLNPIYAYPTLDPLKDTRLQREEMVRTALERNPFRKLGVYETISEKYYNAAPNGKFYGGMRYYGLKKNPSYCEQVDLFNLYRPVNVFGPLKFVTDYAGEEFLVRKWVMPRHGIDVMPSLRMTMPISDYRKPLHGIPLNATMYFFKRVNIHQFYQTNQQIACLSQMYNHIPGHGVLTRKDLVVDAIKDYLQGYESRPQCLKENLYFPLTYRLNNKEECTRFFQEVESQEYQTKKKIDPIQYIIKVGYGAHRAAGLALFGDIEETQLRHQYANGANCGEIKRSLVAQRYISNPLLLDKGNKFDFRIYMLVASVNPLIVYYHDGFLRVSLSNYDKHSSEKNVHFTNTHLSKKLFATAGSTKEYEGMTEMELRDYQMWTMEELEDYLYETGKIKDKSWLDKELRPKFKEAFIHLSRMADKSFYKSSSVFELYGLDFVMDENLDIWFIECNASPQLVGTNAVKARFLSKMLSDMFDLEHAYLKSRMKRVHNFVKEMEKMGDNDAELDYTQLRPEFERININKFEPEFMPKEGNGFKLIMDQNLEGSAAYFGNLREECL